MTHRAASMGLRLSTPREKDQTAMVNGPMLTFVNRQRHWR
jgi:hypothetical protein